MYACICAYIHTYTYANACDCVNFTTAFIATTAHVATTAIAMAETRMKEITTIAEVANASVCFTLVGMLGQ